MKLTNFVLSIASLTTLALTFSSCGNATNSNRATNTANSSNVASVANSNPPTNANSSSANNTASSQNASSDIRRIDFLNHSYQSAACAEDVGLPETVRVRNGRFSEGSNFYNVIENQVVYGDVNADGREDAVIQITCGSSAGTLRAFEIHAYTFQNGQAVSLARLDSGGVEHDYKSVYPEGSVFALAESGARIENGQLIVEALADGSFAGPENIATFRYRLIGYGFELVGQPTRRRRSQ